MAESNVTHITHVIVRFGFGFVVEAVEGAGDAAPIAAHCAVLRSQQTTRFRRIHIMEPVSVVFMARF